MIKRNTSTLALIGLGLCLASPLQADGLAGLWEIQGTPDGAPGPAFTNLARIGKDGDLTNVDPWFGTGLGQWEKVGGKSYAVSFIHYFLADGAVGEVMVDGSLTLGEDGASAAGDFVTTISVGGFVIDSVSGTIAANRQ